MQIDNKRLGEVKLTADGRASDGGNSCACCDQSKTTVMLAKVRQHGGCWMILWCELKHAGSACLKRAKAYLALCVGGVTEQTIRPNLPALCRDRCPHTNKSTRLHLE